MVLSLQRQRDRVNTNDDKNRLKRSAEENPSIGSCETFRFNNLCIFQSSVDQVKASSLPVVDPETELSS